MLVIEGEDIANLLNLRLSTEVASGDEYPISVVEMDVAAKYSADTFRNKVREDHGIEVNDEDVAIVIPEEQEYLLGNPDAHSIIIYACWLPYSDRAIVHGGAYDGHEVIINPETLDVIGIDDVEMQVIAWAPNDRMWVLSPYTQQI